ncbi:hypothetical protein bcgnr5380_62780 [Bacillus cereus]
MGVACAYRRGGAAGVKPRGGLRDGIYRSKPRAAAFAPCRSGASRDGDNATLTKVAA